MHGPSSQLVQLKSRNMSMTDGSPVFGGAIVGNSGVYTVRKRRSSDPPSCRPRFQHTMYFSYSGHSGHVAPAPAWRVLRPVIRPRVEQQPAFLFLQHWKAEMQPWQALTYCVMSDEGSSVLSAKGRHEGVVSLTVCVAVSFHFSHILDIWLETKRTD